MKKSLLGFDKAQIDQLMKEMEHDFTVERNLLRKELDQVVANNASLIESLKKNKETSSSLQNCEQQNLGLLNAQELITLMKEQSTKELAALKKTSNDRIEQFQKEIEALEKEIQEIETMIHRSISSLQRCKQQKEHTLEQYEQIREEQKPLQLKLKKLNSDKSSMEYEEKEKRLLQKELDALKSQYIVGKVAGEDIFTQDGTLIIGQDEKITVETVDLAQREGKLADLIVAMKIQALGED